MIAAAIVAVIVARIRLLDVPLERDEGEYGYLGQLILQGIPPYGVAANMKLPGTYLAYAAIMAVFGQNTVAIHLGLLLVDMACAALIYAIAKRLFPADLLSGRLSAPALAASGAFLVLAVGPGVLGVWAHATHFVVVFALAAALLLLKWSSSRNVGALLGSGLLCGMAFLMKQPGLLFAPFGALWITWTYGTATNTGAPGGPRFSLKRRGGPLLVSLILFSLGVAAPFGLTCLWLWRAGVFDRFWFWIVTYGRQYGSMISIGEGIQAFWLRGPDAMLGAWAIWLLAFLGGILQWRRLKTHASAVFLLSFFVFSFAAVCPGLYFRQHYFVLVLPAVALLAAAVTVEIPAAKGLFGRNARLWMVTVAMVLPLVAQKDLLFTLTPLQVSKTVYSSGPFVEAIQAADYIQSHSAKDAKIAILGSEPEIFFYSGRHSATPYIYVYSMMEPHPYAARMQDEYISIFEKTSPEYVVLVNNESSWVLQNGSTKRIMDWWPAYGDSHYEQVGLADMRPEGTTYYWDSDATRAVPKAHLFLAVLKRKGT